MSIHESVCVLGLVFCSAGLALASPVSSELLPLVPPGAQIVAGFENYNDPHRHGQLILTTHSDRLDLADWQAITGVDSERIVHEVVEVASSSSQGTLTEHLLLVLGHFDKERIFNAAEENGANRIRFQDEALMIIKPFGREKGDMVDTRWLAIVENRIGIFGTPSMVERALNRYASHADVDMVLRERLSQLRPDVSSWNVLTTSSRGMQNFLLHPGSRWAPLFQDAEVLMVGARFGPKVRVDFSVHAAAERGSDFFKQKAASFLAVFAPGLRDRSRVSRLRDVVYETNHIQGSLEMSMNQFEEWGEDGGSPRNPPPPISRGE
jgi:hypothetical protein